jgi:hypothetical protein
MVAMDRARSWTAAATVSSVRGGGEEDGGASVVVVGGADTVEVGGCGGWMMEDRWTSPIPGW